MKFLVFPSYLISLASSYGPNCCVFFLSLCLEELRGVGLDELRGLALDAVRGLGLEEELRGLLLDEF